MSGVFRLGDAAFKTVCRKGWVWSKMSCDKAPAKESAPTLLQSQVEVEDT